ncbi:hypothetical protein V8G54_014672 [Vigna mungo]|uniref:Uncharacterized protein n=1 Tax=Vigna mungo TaxID=3915 RepID=A0AAQ3RXP2_VIGMU
MYHLSSSSLRNLFTTGDPISALSHAFEGPKSNTNPLEEEECDDSKGGEEENASLAAESDCETLWELEIELASLFDLLCCVSLSALVSGFVEQRRKDGNFEDTGEMVVLGLAEHARDGNKVVGGVKCWKIETFERVLRGCNEGCTIDDDDDGDAKSMAVKRAMWWAC